MLLLEKNINSKKNSLQDPSTEELTEREMH
jgi:hypothetical protein